MLPCLGMPLKFCYSVQKVHGITGQKKWKFQLCIHQASQAGRTTSNDNIFRSITAGYARTTFCLEGRLSNLFITCMLSIQIICDQTKITLCYINLLQKKQWKKKK